MKQKLLLGLLLLLFIVSSSPALAATLKESIDIALKNNPAVIGAQKRAEAARAQLRQAVGAFLPTIKLDGSYGRSYSQPSTTQLTIGGVTQDLTFGTDATAKNKTITTSLSQPIFVAGLFPGYQIGKKSYEAAEEELKKVSQETVFSVKQAYFGVLKSQKFVELAEQSLAMAQNHLARVKTMVAVGSSSRNDFLRTEVQAANAEVSLAKAKNTLELAKNSFNALLGKKLDEGININGDDLVSSLPIVPEYNDLVTICLKYRPDWKKNKLNKEIAEETLRASQTNLLPSVFLTGQIGNRITEYPSYNSDVNSWSLTGLASWTLFDGFSNLNKIIEAQATLAAQKAAEEQLKNGILLEIKEAYLSLRTEETIIGSVKKALQAAEENFKLANILYRTGTGSNLDVIDAQVALTEAQINYYQSIFDVEIAKAKMNKAVGRDVI